MLRSKIALGFAAALLSLLSASSLAAPSCSNWLKQADGSYFRLCVGDDGKTYCQQSKNGTISRVSCK